jgi:Ca-activated chloride channel family protein
MIPLPAALITLLLVALAEWMHARRVRVVARMAFGPRGCARPWTRAVPWLRTAGLTAFAWGLATLWMMKIEAPDAASAKERLDAEATRLVFVADLSPSMHLPDAGADGTMTRHERMREVVEGILQRVSGNLRFGVIGFYTDSLPVVMEARDPELVRNVFNGLPLTFAMPHGKTDLGTAVNRTLELVADFPRDSTRVILLTDGDSTPLAALQPRPASVRELLVLGVGNPRKGSYIDGHQSRQETATLRSVAGALGGVYHDVNENQLPTDALGDLVVPLALPNRGLTLAQWAGLTLAQWAVLAMVLGALVNALLPVALEYFGADWKLPKTALKPAVLGKKEVAAR